MKKSKSAMKEKKTTKNLRKNSPDKYEDHIRLASHVLSENQENSASHRTQENHIRVASQNIIRELGRISAGAYYDHQQVRIQGANRIRDIIRKKVEGINFDEVEEKKDEEEKYQEKFKDAEIPILLKQLKEDDKITQREFNYINRMMEVHKKAEQYEKEYKKLMDEFVEQEPIYQKFLKHIKGISAILSANLIKEFGYCENAQHISSLWKYCGMDVINGEAPVRKKGEKLGFNAKIRTMVWKISDSFVKQRTPFYRDIYDKEKIRQVKMLDNLLEGLSKEDKKKFNKISKRDEKREFVSNVDSKSPVSLMNADLRAKRKAVKIFLAHYWMACKEIQPTGIKKPKNLSEPYQKRKPIEISEHPYVSSKLGHKHISDWKDAVNAQLKETEKKTKKKVWVEP